MSRMIPSREGIGFLLNHASRSVVSQMRDKLRAVGLDHDMWTMIQNMRQGGEAGADPVESAAQLRVPQGAMIDATERLVRDGWAKAAPGRAAGARMYVLTPKATKALHGLDSEARLLIEHATNGFTNDEIEVLAGYLRRIIDNMA